jgi:thiosulfate reductase/polysulfide reductase chain A
MAGTRIGRRDFLKLSGMVGAAAGFGMTGMLRLKPGEVQAALAATDEWIATTCQMCGGTTGVLAHVANGRVVKIEPNSYNPAGVANISTDFHYLVAHEDTLGKAGRMCPKGNAAMMSLYDPDRVKKPLKRAGARGAGQWQEISYDQAAVEIASKLAAIRAAGPEKLVWFTEDNNFIPIQESFGNAYGTPNFLQHSNLCDVARKFGFEKTLGHGRPLPDLKNTKYMLIFGWNPLGAMKWAHLPRILLDGLANGAKLVLVDPRCSETAAKAKDSYGRWVPIRPGTDGALALALANVIISQGLYDASFVGQWTAGFDQFAAFVANKTPDWAAGITGVKANTIRDVAVELATTKPAVIDSWSGVSHHTNGSEGTRAIACLAGLLGQVDAPGTLIIPERAGPKFFTGTPSPLPRVDNPKINGVPKYPFPHGSGIYIEARDAMLSGIPYRPRAAVFVFQNFVLAVPNSRKNLDAISQLELIVSVDTHLSETAQMADYVIPGTTFLERYDLYPQWVTFTAISLRQPAVPPLFGQKVEYELVQDLALRLGLTTAKGQYPFNVPYTQYLSDALLAGIGITLDQLKALPGAVWTGGDTHYHKYLSGGFATPSKKFEFYSQQMNDKGLNPLPDYAPAKDGPTSTYPLYLVNWKEALHTHSRTMNNRWLMEFHGENEVWINRGRAQVLGIADGSTVWVENQYAKAQAKARVTDRIHPDVVGMTHGFGHWALGPVAQGKGINDTQCIPGRADPISGMAAHKDGAVRVYKA